MAFSSVAFLFYFLPIAFVLYILFSFSRSMQNLILVMLGFLFYAWGEPTYSYLLLFIIGLNYATGLGMGLSTKYPSIRKVIFSTGLIANVGFLIWMKYTPFISTNLSNATQGVIPAMNWILPAGISFYVFSGISYLVDVYRHDAVVEKNLISLSLYFNFFPKLMQGPISRYTDFTSQIHQRDISIDHFSDGITRFITGLSKKVLLSNQMGIVTDRIFEIMLMEDMSILLAWIGIIAYTFQIYYDFSGYSDMAIGLAKMLGFNLPENFNYPYISRSIGEFWRRWHITLGVWFKHYLYFPLGGSRVKNQDTILRNLAIVWLVTGLWHGANWTFLVWGLWNYIFIALERIFQFEQLKIRTSVRHIYTMFVVMMGWVIFRSASITEASHYMSYLFNFVSHPLTNDYAWMFLKEYGIFFIMSFIFAVPIAPLVNGWITKGIAVRRRIPMNSFVSDHRIMESIHFKSLLTILYPVIMSILFVVSVMYLVKGTYNSFIYFQF